MRLSDFHCPPIPELTRADQRRIIRAMAIAGIPAADAMCSHGDLSTWWTSLPSRPAVSEQMVRALWRAIPRAHGRM